VRGATPQAAFQAVVHAVLEQVETNARGLRASSDPEVLHQLRVGLRRLRSALRAFDGILGQKETKRLRRSLRKLSPKLGRARDLDVLVQRLEANRASVDLIARVRKQRNTARMTARRTVSSKAFARMLAEARTIAPEESGQTLTQFGAAALARAHRKLRKAAQGIDWQDPAQRHAVRIRVKRLRYSCEFFAPAFASRRAPAYVSALKTLQEVLGELNDIAVGRELLPEFRATAEEAVLLPRLAPAWARFAQRPVFWPAPR
jgi:CHAD domain-containing protein